MKFGKINQKLIKAAVLILFGGFLYTLISSGAIYFYINDRFIMLVALAAIGFVLVGISFVWRDASSAPAATSQMAEQAHGNELTLAGLLIVALPLMLGWLIPPKPLGAAAVGNREINVGQLASVAPPQEDGSINLAAGRRNILDWLAAFQRASDPATFNGQEATVIGFVYRDDRFAADSFMVGRFTVSCCVADAAPIGLIVRYDGALDLSESQWVEVQGHFEVGTFNGVTMPILQVDSLQEVAPPAQPYLYL